MVVRRLWELDLLLILFLEGRVGEKTVEEKTEILS